MACSSLHPVSQRESRPGYIQTETHLRLIHSFWRNTMSNPHFDEGLVIWRDEYAGRFSPPAGIYEKQFDFQWRIALEGNREYYENPGASVDERYIADRIYEWT